MNACVHKIELSLQHADVIFYHVQAVCQETTWTSPKYLTIC